MNYYKGLMEIAESGEYRDIPTKLLKDYINDFTIELKSREQEFKSGDTVEITGNSNAHEFTIGEKVVLDYFEDTEWFTKGPNCCWWIKEIDIKLSSTK